MEKLDPVRRKVKELVEERGANLAEISRAIGKNHAYLHQFINRHTPRKLPEDARRALAAYFRISDTELGGVRDGLIRDGANGEPIFDVIREVDVRASAGAGSIVDYENSSDVWAFPEFWVRSELRARIADLRVLTIDGDSMVSSPPSARDLDPGDRIIVNVVDRVPTPPGVFILHDGLGLVAKRLEHIDGSDPPTVRISSNNLSYGPYERTLDEVHIAGRVVGRWQRV